MELLAKAKAFKGPPNRRAEPLEVRSDRFDVVRASVKLEHPPGQRRDGGLELHKDTVAPLPPVCCRGVRQPHVVRLEYVLGSYQPVLRAEDKPCLLYTSDAADEEDSVDLGGRRIIKK